MNASQGLIRKMERKKIDSLRGSKYLIETSIRHRGQKQMSRERGYFFTPSLGKKEMVLNILSSKHNASDIPLGISQKSFGGAWKHLIKLHFRSTWHSPAVFYQLLGANKKISKTIFADG